MKRLLAYLADLTCNWWLRRQRSGRWFPLNKMEFRAMQVSFSQFGEDLRVRSFASQMGISRGFYVDAGAYDPIWGSNTLWLYKAGWTGVNIEMVPERLAEFQARRPLDHNVCAALDCEEREVFYSADRQTENRIYREPTGSAVHRVKTRTLNSVLADLGLPDRAIDYLNIDCEHADFRVLQGLSLERHPVRLLTIEALDPQNENEIKAYLSQRGMQFCERIGLTLLFRASA